MKVSNRQMRGGSSGMHPERRVTLDSIRCCDLLPHPLSVKIYGKPKPTADLLQSIEKVGLLQPLIVNDYGDGSYELLVGNTRAVAWQILHKQGKVKSLWIPCQFVHLSPIEAQRLIIESNRQRVKKLSQKAREFKELKRIETALAKQRMLAGKKLDPKANLPEGSKGQARDKAAATVGLGARTAEKLEKVVDAADEGDAKAQAALTAVDAGTLSITQAYQTVAPPKDPEKIDAGKAAARELSKLFKNGEVTRSKKDGLFHVLIRDISPEQIGRLAGMLAEEEAAA